MLREWSPEAGNSQFETREKDFFFLRGGCGDCKTSGNGGGGGMDRSGRVDGREEAMDGDGDVNVADASVKGTKREGIWTDDGAVLGL